MWSFELLARLRKELSLTGSALYESVVTLAERVNRKVQALRLHSQAVTVQNQIHTLHRDIGRRLAELTDKSLMGSSSDVRSRMLPLEGALHATADRIKAQRAALQQIEGQIRDVTLELAREDLLTMQRELSLRDASIERIVVGPGAPVIGHPIGEFDFPPTTRLVAVFRGPFLLPLSDALTLRQDDVVILVGLRHHLSRWLPRFQKASTSKSA